MRRANSADTSATSRTLGHSVLAVGQADHGRAGAGTRAGTGHIVSLCFEDRVLSHAFANGLLEFGSLEQGRAVRDPGNRLVSLEDPAGHAHVDLLARFEIEAQPAEHESDQAACSGAGDQIKVVAWLGDLVTTWRFAVAFDVAAIHEFLEDDEHGVAADAASIWLG